MKRGIDAPRGLRLAADLITALVSISLVAQEGMPTLHGDGDL